MAFSTHDIVPDSPTNNFCTLNVLDNNDGTLLQGALQQNDDGSDGWDVVRSTFGVSSGKWYWEVLPTPVTSVIGVSVCTNELPLNTLPGQNHNTGVTYYPNGKIYKETNGNGALYGQTYSGNIIGVLLDMDAGSVTFYKDNSSQGSASSNLLSYGDTWFPCGATFYSGSSQLFNFGQDPTFGGAKSPTTTYTDANGIGAFYYPPPADALALCTANLPEMTPDVADDVPQDYFKTLTYTGSTTQTTTLDFNSFTPDLLWIKNRYDSASTNISHALIDSVRGGDKVLASDSTSNESVVSSAVTFNNDNTVSLLAGYSRINNASNSRTYVAWGWKSAGSPSGSTSTTGSAKRINTSGTQDDTSCSALATAATNAGASNVITPTLMSINQAAGFSIVTFTSPASGTASVVHGLNNTPEFIITKSRTNQKGWLTYESTNGATNYLELNSTSQSGANSSIWNDTEPTSSVFSIGTWFNSNGGDVVAYCWHSVEGYSKFGSYTGNGSTDGPFVYCGFRPAWVMIKRTDALDNWLIQDSTRTPFNWTCNMLVANNSNQENTTEAESTYGRDYLSNGFKIRASHSSHNATNGTYIYAAFAEQPFKFSNAR